MDGMMKQGMCFVIAVMFVCLLTGCDEGGVENRGIVSEGATVVKLAGEFKFTEGPASDSEGNVYFTDIPNKRICKYSLDGELTTFLENSREANGLYFDINGMLIACAGGSGELLSINPQGGISVVASEYKGKRFNSPNDLWIDPKGGIYFTDPRYGNRDNLPQDGEHVYYLRPDRKEVIRVVDDMVRPNGIIGTPDGKVLYVADHGAGIVYSFSINPDGTLSTAKAFVSQASDGLTLDEQGNLYVTAKNVEVYNKNGELIKTIEMPEVPANVCFGGAGNNVLFVTARTFLYSIPMLVNGVR